eukprot:1862871-Pyramimonas_sp.AAC.1
MRSPRNLPSRRRSARPQGLDDAERLLDHAHRRGLELVSLRLGNRQRLGGVSPAPRAFALH